MYIERRTRPYRRTVRHAVQWRLTRLLTTTSGRIFVISKKPSRPDYQDLEIKLTLYFLGYHCSPWFYWRGTHDLWCQMVCSARSRVGLGICKKSWAQSSNLPWVTTLASCNDQSLETRSKTSFSGVVIVIINIAWRPTVHDTVSVRRWETRHFTLYYLLRSTDAQMFCNKRRIDRETTK